VLGIPAPTLAAVARSMRQHLDATLTGTVATVVRETALLSPMWQHFIALSEQLVGTPRHLGLHTALFKGVWQGHSRSA
jgi:hypothetical protein